MSHTQFIYCMFLAWKLFLSCLQLKWNGRIFLFLSIRGQHCIFKWNFEKSHPLPNTKIYCNCLCSQWNHQIWPVIFNLSTRKRFNYCHAIGVLKLVLELVLELVPELVLEQVIEWSGYKNKFEILKKTQVHQKVVLLKLHQLKVERDQITVSIFLLVDYFKKLAHFIFETKFQRWVFKSMGHIWSYMDHIWTIYEPYNMVHIPVVIWAPLLYDIIYIVYMIWNEMGR